MRRFKLPKLRHPWAKSAAGFTLVELIVVIAILGVLAGVGTVGYSGYVKNSQKNADKALVGNIIRAVETGHNSYAFQFNEVLQAAADQGLQVPIGFVVVTENGCTTVQSGNKETSSMSSPACNVVSNVTVYIGANQTNRTNGKNWGECGYQAETAWVLGESVTSTFCTIHSPAKYHENAKYFTSPGANDLAYDSKSFYEISDRTLLVTDHENGESYINLPVYGTNDAVTNDADSSITQTLIAAYGDNYQTDMKLKYNGWKNINVSAFFADATDNWEKIMEKLNTATGFLGGLALQQTKENGEKYGSEDKAKLMNDYASVISTRYKDNRDGFIEMWEGVLWHDKELVIKQGNQCAEAFLGAVGGEDAFYFSGRSLWNQSLATYIKNHSSCANKTSHATKVEGYGINLGIVVPKACNYHSFTERIQTFDVSGIEVFLEPIGCTVCQTAAKEYVTSGTAAADAGAIYDTLATIHATADQGVLKGDDFNDIDFFEYYERYMYEFDTLYSTVNDVQGASKIVVSFYYQNGKLTYEVSNDDADPRK